MSEMDMRSSDFSELQEIAHSPAGQNLLDYLRKNNEPELQEALNQAVNGDFSQAKNIIEQLLSSPEGSELLNALQI